MQHIDVKAVLSRTKKQGHFTLLKLTPTPNVDIVLNVGRDEVPVDVSNLLQHGNLFQNNRKLKERERG